MNRFLGPQWAGNPRLEMGRDAARGTTTIAARADRSRRVSPPWGPAVWCTGTFAGTPLPTRCRQHPSMVSTKNVANAAPCPWQTKPSGVENQCATTREEKQSNRSQEPNKSNSLGPLVKGQHPSVPLQGESLTVGSDNPVTPCFLLPRAPLARSLTPSPS